MDISKAAPIGSAEADSQPILQIPSQRDPSADDRLEPSPRKGKAAKEKKEKKKKKAAEPIPEANEVTSITKTLGEDDGAVLLASQDDLTQHKSSIHNTKSALVAPSSLPETTLKEGGSQDYGPMGSDEDDIEGEYDEDEEYDDEEEEAEEEVDEVQ